MGSLKRQHLDVVSSVKQQTADAAALASIAGQDQLADPRTNPAVRAHADRLRDEQHRKALDAEHSRLLRRHRVEDRRAEHAERTLEVIRAARQASSPARSVMALHAGRRRFLGVALAASLSLSIGSAMGVAHLASRLGAPSAVGYVAEVGLTGLTTTVILYRSHLAEHGGTVEKWQAKGMWLLIVLPLLATITANAISNGAVGVFCSAGAAAFSLLSAIISDRSAVTIRARAAEVTTDEETELQAAATGNELFGVSTEARRDAEAFDSRLFSDEDLCAWLNESSDDELHIGPVRPGVLVPEPTEDGDSDGDVGALPDAPEMTAMRPDQIDANQRQDNDDSDCDKGLKSATEARRAAGRKTRARVAAYLAQHPDATVEEIASALNLSMATVKRHRRAIRSGD
jgi:hypothetical protein